MAGNRDIHVMVGATVGEIGPSGVTYERDGEIHTIACDTVLNAAGFRMGDQFKDVLEDAHDDVFIVGDAVRPCKILDAVHEGCHAIRIMG